MTDSTTHFDRRYANTQHSVRQPFRWISLRNSNAFENVKEIILAKLRAAPVGAALCV